MQASKLYMHSSLSTHLLPQPLPPPSLFHNTHSLEDVAWGFPQVVDAVAVPSRQK